MSSASQRPDSEEHKSSDSQDAEPEQPGGDHPPGPNLILIYALLALGLLIAAGVAATIVWPFYIRR